MPALSRGLLYVCQNNRGEDGTPLPVNLLRPARRRALKNTLKMPIFVLLRIKERKPMERIRLTVMILTLAGRA